MDMALFGKHRPRGGESWRRGRRRGLRDLGRNGGLVLEGLETRLAPTADLLSGVQAADIVALATAATTTTVTVTPSTLVSGQSVTLDVTVAPTGAGSGVDPTGSVEFFSGMKSLGMATLANGMGSTTTTSLDASDTNVTAHYSGDDNYSPSDTDTPFPVTVTQATSHTLLGIDPNPSNPGDTVTLTATVSAEPPGSGTPTGSVTFLNGSTPLGPGAVTLVNGVATLPLPANTLPSGATVITAHYGGDTNFTPGDSAPMTATVRQGSMTTLMSSSTSITFGQLVTLTSTVAATSSGTGTPTGTVEFFNGNTMIGMATLSNGTATLPNQSLNVGTGTASLRADYQGDGTFEASSSPIETVTVAAASTTTTVQVSPQLSATGQPVTIMATVASPSAGAGTPTGTVNFFNGSNPLGNGTLANGIATLPPITTLPAGANSITATYVPGNTNFTASTSQPVIATVGQNSTTVLTASNNGAPIVTGQPITLTATVTGSGSSATPTGNVTFFSNGTSIGNANLTNGVATLTNTTALTTVGTPNLTATYNGDNTFSTSTSAAVPVTVNQAQTTSVVTVTPNPATANQAVTLMATVTPVSPATGTPTGSVEFFNNGTTSLGAIALSSGSATIALPSLPTGTNSITVMYRGDTNYASSTSPAVTVPVLQATTTTVAASPNPTVVGQPVTLTAAVNSIAGTPTGLVQFTATLNGAVTNLGVAQLSGTTAMLTTTALGLGFNRINASYLGDGTFAPSNTQTPVVATITATVSQASTTTAVTSSANPSPLGTPVTFTATVTATPPGSGIPTGSVLFMNGTTTLGTATLNNGVATLTTSTLSIGNNPITAQYLADNNFGPSTSPTFIQVVSLGATTVTLKLSENNPVSAESVLMTATVAATAPATGTPTGTVNFFINGTMIGSGTLSNGQATFVASGFNLGTQTVTAVYAGDNRFAGNSSSAPLNIVVGDNNESYLNQVYLKVFHRVVDSGGISTWQPLLADGLPRRRIVREIVTAPEHTSKSTTLLHEVLGPKARRPRSNAKLVNELTVALFGKPQSASFQDRYVRQLNHGVNVNQVIVNMLASNEFYAYAVMNPVAAKPPGTTA
jgi:hypothetical protein